MTPIDFTDLERALEGLTRDPDCMRAALEELQAQEEALLAPVLAELRRLEDSDVRAQRGFLPLPPPPPMVPQGVFGGLAPATRRRRRSRDFCLRCSFLDSTTDRLGGTK